MFPSITPSFIFWVILSHLNPELINSANLVSHLTWETPCVYLYTMLSPLRIYVGARDLNSSPHAYMIRILLAEKFCQPPKCFLNKWMDLKLWRKTKNMEVELHHSRKDLGFVFSPVQFDHKTLNKPLLLFIIKESFGIGWIINTYFNTENLESGFNIKWLLRWA